MVCYECNSFLTIEDEKTTHGEHRIAVAPCNNCVDRAKDEGREEGRKEAEDECYSHASP